MCSPLLLCSVDLSVTRQNFKFPLKHAACHPNVYFCSASDGSNVVKTFHSAIAAAREYKSKAASEDFSESVLEAVEYFKHKEKQINDKQAEAPNNA